MTGGDDGRLVSTMPTEKLSLSRKCRALGRTDRGQHGIRLRAAAMANSSPLRPNGSGSGRSIIRTRWAAWRSTRKDGLPPPIMAARAYVGEGRSQKPKSLARRGRPQSDLQSDEYIVTATQENDLHGGARRADMRMSGYPAKVRSMSWLPKGRRLAQARSRSSVGRFTEKADRWARRQSTSAVAWRPITLNTKRCRRSRYQDGTTILVQIDRPHSVLVAGWRRGCRARLVGGRTASRAWHGERIYRANWSF